jgi:hypothetical protein
LDSRVDKASSSACDFSPSINGVFPLISCSIVKSGLSDSKRNCLIDHPSALLDIATCNGVHPFSFSHSFGVNSIGKFSDMVVVVVVVIVSFLSGLLAAAAATGAAVSDRIGSDAREVGLLVLRRITADAEEVEGSEDARDEAVATSGPLLILPNNRLVLLVWNVGGSDIDDIIDAATAAGDESGGGEGK